MPGCFLKGCKSRWGRKNEEYNLHIFPRDANLSRKWLIQLGYTGQSLEKLLEKITATQRQGNFRICSKHFSKECYETRGSGFTLKRGSVPTLYLQSEPEIEHDYALPSTSKYKTEFKSSRSGLRSKKERSLEPSFEDKVEITSVPLFPEDNFYGSYKTLPEISDVDMTEVVVSSESTSATSSGFQASEKKGKNAKQIHVRSVACSTDNCPSRHCKSTQFNPFFGTKHKGVQILRRPLHRSIGIQCNFGVTETQIEIDVMPQRKQDLETQFLDDCQVFVQKVAEEQEIVKKSLMQNFSPMNRAGRLVDIQECSLSDSDAFESPKKKRMVTVKEEEEFEQNMCLNEDFFYDPKNMDNSYILLPNLIEKPHPVHEKKFIVFESCLDQLLFSSNCKGRVGCNGKIISIKKYRIGTAISVTGYCSNKHRFHLWRSQPLIGRMPVGNLLLSSGVQCTGSNFLKVESLFDAIGIYGISKSTHNENQNKFLFPTIHQHWQKNRQKILEELGDGPVALSVDHQFDTPVDSAKCCTYFFLENKSKKIIDFQIEKVCHGARSGSLEVRAFKTGLDRILENNVNIRLLSTDRQVSVRKVMKTSYTNIAHKFDVWHVAKSIGTEMAVACKKANLSALSDWVMPAKNHLWWSAKTCSLHPQMLKEQWTSIIYHVSNQHSWESDEGYHHCLHPPLTKQEIKQRKWLPLDSPAHTKFKEIILNPRLLKDLEHLSNVCNTEEFEEFHRTLLGYSECNHCFLDDITARTQLAVLDHNHNTERSTARTRDKDLYPNKMDERRQRLFLHKSKYDWLMEGLVKKANMDFIFEIMTDVIDFAMGSGTFDWQYQQMHEPANRTHS